MAEEPKKAAAAHGSEPVRIDTTGGLVKLALGGLFFYGATLFTGGLLASYGLVALVAKAILAEIGLSRLGIAWSFDGEKTGDPKQMAKAFGAGLGTSAIVALLVVVSRAGRFDPGGLVVATLATGMLSALATAVFQELFFRGLVLRLTEKVNVLSLRIAAGGAASFAAVLAEPGATVLEAAVAGTIGATCAALWLRERGSYTAMAAHAGWLFGARAIFRGGLFELAGSKTILGGLGEGPFAGGIAWLVVGVAFVLSVVALRRAQSAVPATTAAGKMAVPDAPAP